MREERGRLAGDMVVAEPFELWGSISGNVKVIDGAKFYMRGAIYGNLTVEFGGRVHIFGNVTGDVKLARGSKVIVSGVIGGDAVNDGGRLFVDNSAKVVGRVKTRSGDTKIEPKATIMEQ